MEPRNDFTQLLLQLGAGDDEALDRLMPLAYDALQAMARRQLRDERPGHTLSTVGLVHEAYLKLVDQDRVAWQNRAHFFAIASIAMRRILVGYARRRGRQKRGGGMTHVSLSDGLVLRAEARGEDLLALDEALTRLAALSERAARVVECRYFGGLDERETAAALGVARRTVARDWQFARAWLRRELSAE